jgi:hypothetical protein
MKKELTDQIPSRTNVSLTCVLDDAPEKKNEDFEIS